MNVKQAKKGTTKPIHPFKTLDEEAEYWDTHSIVDEIKENAPVGFHRATTMETLTIRFTHEDIERLRSEAEHKGIGATTLARMWVRERLQATT